jgi:DNA-directed RNA polymerase specialized sigma54-like protein
LQLSLSQQLAIAPQLQHKQSRLLQLSAPELQQEIQLALVSYLLLEQNDLYAEINTTESKDIEGLGYPSSTGIEENI